MTGGKQLNLRPIAGGEGELKGPLVVQFEGDGAVDFTAGSSFFGLGERSLVEGDPELIGPKPQKKKKITFSRLTPEDEDTLKTIADIQANNTREGIMSAIGTVADGFLSLQSDEKFMKANLDFDRSVVIHESVRTETGYVRGKVLGYLIGFPLDKAHIDDHYYTEAYAERCLEHINAFRSTALEMHEVLVGQIYLDPSLRGLRVHGLKQVGSESDWEILGEITTEVSEGAERLAAKLYRFVHRKSDDTRKAWMARINQRNLRSQAFHVKAFRSRGVVLFPEVDRSDTKIYEAPHRAGDIIMTRDLTLEYPNEDQT